MISVIAPKVPAAGIVEEYFRIAQLRANGAKRILYVLAIADIADEILHRRPALPNLAREPFQIVRFAGEHCDRVGFSKAIGSVKRRVPDQLPSRPPQASSTEYSYFNSPWRSFAMILSNSTGPVASI